MTPLIDVSLVLVVMLLLMTPLALETNLGIRSALASGRQEAGQEVERVEIHVVDDVSVQVNEKAMPRSEMGAALVGLLAGQSAPTVAVSCEADVSHGTFVEVLDVAKSAGAAEIAFVGR